jgi:DTW domain-containing protein YfiP
MTRTALSRDLVRRACGEGCNFPECACSHSPMPQSPVDVLVFFHDRAVEDRERHVRQSAAFNRWCAEYFAGRIVS